MAAHLRAKGGNPAKVRLMPYYYRAIPYPYVRCTHCVWSTIDRCIVTRCETPVWRLVGWIDIRTITVRVCDHQ